MALVQAGFNPHQVLSARLMVLPGLSPASALARELAWRFLAPFSRRSEPLELLDDEIMPPGDPADDASIPTPVARPTSTTKCDTNPPTHNPATFPSSPLGPARDWIDAAGPSSLRDLRILNRLI